MAPGLFLHHRDARPGRADQRRGRIERDANAESLERRTEAALVEKSRDQPAALEERQDFRRDPSAQGYAADREVLERQVGRLGAVNRGKESECMDAAGVASSYCALADSHRRILYI